MKVASSGTPLVAAAEPAAQSSAQWVKLCEPRTTPHGAASPRGRPLPPPQPLRQSDSSGRNKPGPGAGAGGRVESQRAGPQAGHAFWEFRFRTAGDPSQLSVSDQEFVYARPQVLKHSTSEAPMTKDEASTTRGVDSDRDRERVDPRRISQRPGRSRCSCVPSPLACFTLTS